MLSGISLAWLALSPAGDGARHEQPSRRELARILRSAVVVTALTEILLAVLVDQMVSLLVPLQLDENGLSAGAMTLGPIGSERVASAIGQTWTYGGLAIAAVTAGSCMLLASRTDRADVTQAAAAAAETTEPAGRAG